MGLPTWITTSSIVDVIEWGFPGITSGVDPVVRPWNITVLNRFKGPGGEGRLSRACRWMLEVACPVFDPSTGAFDKEKILRTNWLHEMERHHLAPARTDKGYLNARDLLVIGSAELGHPNLVGWSDTQIPSFEIRTNKMWRVESGVLSDLTKRVLHDISRSAKYVDEAGVIDPAKLKGAPLDSFFQRYAGTSWKEAGLSAAQALAKEAPDLFGLASGKMWFWDFKLASGLDIRQHRQIFREAFAVALARNGIGDLKPVQHTFTCTLEDFGAAGIAGAFANGVAELLARAGMQRLFSTAPEIRGDGKRAIAALFGYRPDLADGYPDFDEQRLFEHLLEYEGGLLRLSINKLKTWTHAVEITEGERELVEQLNLRFHGALDGARELRDIGAIQPKDELILWKLRAMVTDSENPRDFLTTLVGSVLDRSRIPSFTEDDLVEVIRLVASKVLPKCDLSESVQLALVDRFDALISIDSMTRRARPSIALAAALETPEEATPAMGVSVVDLVTVVVPRLLQHGSNPEAA
jgi:hypothetical protein